LRSDLAGLLQVCPWPLPLISFADLGSPSMEGTLLDQRVFEALVQRCLPTIKDHFASVDVQLSVASLPYVSKRSSCVHG